MKDEKYFADIIINEEKLSDGKTAFVVHCTNLGIASQGDTTEEAVKNIKEAIELYLEEEPEDFNLLRKEEVAPLFSFVEVNKNAQVASAVR